MRDKHQIIEEPCEEKFSRTVLKTSEAGDSLAEFNREGFTVKSKAYTYLNIQTHAVDIERRF
jgi:hypothetical protein